MIRMFMFIGILRGLRARAPQPPNSVARCHQPRESVTSHTRERYAHILFAQQVSRHPPAPRTKKEPGREQGTERSTSEGKEPHTSTAARTSLTPLLLSLAHLQISLIC